MDKYPKILPSWIKKLVSRGVEQYEKKENEIVLKGTIRIKVGDTVRVQMLDKDWDVFGEWEIDLSKGDSVDLAGIEYIHRATIG